MFTDLGDRELLVEVKRLAHREHEATADLVAALVELDGRWLCLGAGYSSLFAYCTHALRLTDEEAGRLIEAARAARRFSVILERLRRGELTLTTVGLLAPHLTPGNHGAMLDAARHRSARAVEALLARLGARPGAEAEKGDRARTPNRA